jgi:hypothetical protein
VKGCYHRYRLCQKQLFRRPTQLSVALRKGAILAPTWSLCLIAVRKEPFPLPAIGFSERPGAVKGAPLLGAAKRTLDGEDRSKIILKRERRGERLVKCAGAKMAHSPGATDNPIPGSGVSREESYKQAYA